MPPLACRSRMALCRGACEDRLDDGDAILFEIAEKVPHPRAEIRADEQVNAERRRAGLRGSGREMAAEPIACYLELVYPHRFSEPRRPDNRAHRFRRLEETGR